MIKYHPLIMKIILKHIIKPSAVLFLVVFLLSVCFQAVAATPSYHPDSEKVFSALIESSLQNINTNSSFNKNQNENNYGGGYISKIILVNEYSKARLKLFYEIIYRNSTGSIRLKNFLSAQFSTSV